MQQLKVELLLTQAVKNEPLKKFSKTLGKMTQAEACGMSQHSPSSRRGGRMHQTKYRALQTRDLANQEPLRQIKNHI
jgi:hypothetical protein